MCYYTALISWVELLDRCISVVGYRYFAVINFFHILLPEHMLALSQGPLVPWRGRTRCGSGRQIYFLLGLQTGEGGERKVSACWSGQQQLSKQYGNWLPTLHFLKLSLNPLSFSKHIVEEGQMGGTLQGGTGSLKVTDFQHYLKICTHQAFRQPPGYQRVSLHTGGSQAWRQRHQGILQQLPNQIQFDSSLVRYFLETE